jgi:hypothetical protein
VVATCNVPLLALASCLFGLHSCCCGVKATFFSAHSCAHTIMLVIVMQYAAK